MNDLIEFLRARIDEDERIALATQTCNCGRCEMPLAWTIDDDGIDPLGVGLRHTVAPGYLNPEQGAHIVHQDPDRTLREVEAKRRILEFTLEQVRWIDEYTHTPYAEGAEIDLLESMAWPYSDHPEWREEWRPTSA